MVVSILSDILLKAHIPFSIREITDVSVFLQKGVQSVPAIQMDDDLIYGLKSNGSFSNSLRTALMNILSTANYGDLPKIVIPIDFSDTSVNALSYGHRLATDMGAVTKTLYAYVPDPTEVLSTGKGQDEILAERKKELEHLTSALNTDWASDILKVSMAEAECVVGFPTEQIVSAADRNNAALIILGTTGAAKSKEIFGSVSTSVIDASAVPILLIPEQAKYTGVNRIAYAYQDEKIDQHCLTQVADFCRHFNTELHLVHVVRAASTSTYDPSSAIKNLYPTDLLHMHIVEDDNDPARALSSFAVDHHIDILAVGTKKKNLFQQLFTRSTSKWLAIHSQVPVLILK